jgi:hypothetical protein
MLIDVVGDLADLLDQGGVGGVDGPDKSQALQGDGVEAGNRTAAASVATVTWGGWQAGSTASTGS